MRTHGAGRRISPSMVVAVIALIVALGGTSYAAVKLPKGSVGSRELKKNAVTTAKMKNNAVTSAKVKTDSLTGEDIKEAALGQVALAARALGSDHANAAGTLDRVTYRSAISTVGPAAGTPTSPVTTISAPASAGCDPGQVAMGGGVKVDDPSSQSIHETYPSTARTWTVTVGNDDEASGHNFTVFVACVPAASVG